MKLSRLLPYVFCVLYLILAIATLPNYGVNWDEGAHFIRGQTFLNYVLTGKKDFSNLPDLEGGSYVQDFGYVFKDEKTHTVIRRSMYQFMPFSFYIDDIENRGNHPVFSDMIAAVSNYIFFQKLGIASDVYSYNFYSVLLGALLVLATFLWVEKIFGWFSGLIASLSLALFPLYWGELHFNVKDIPETVYFSLSIYLFFFAVTKMSLKYLIAFSLVGAMAFATKFNFLFSIFIFLPWISTMIIPAFRKTGMVKIHEFIRNNRLFIVWCLFIPLIFVLVWVGSYPASWFEPKLLLASIAYYKKIGTSASAGLKVYPLYYVLFATPLIILLYWLLGIIFGFKLKGIAKNAFFLVLFWFLVPIIRVMFPRAVIYSGVRQIMEYIPPMAILAGIGAGFLIKIYKNYTRYKQYKDYSFLLQILIFLSFIPITLKMISMHPNESLYFNPLIGGLKGAEEKSIPGAGESLGNEYRQAVLWLNRYAEPNATLVLGYELNSNLPRVWVRNDIAYTDDPVSGTLRKGEYIISTAQIEDRLMWYPMRYVENFLNPVYIITEDGIPLMKIWKNDKEHTKKGYLQEEEAVAGITFTSNLYGAQVNLPEQSFVTRLELDLPNSCSREDTIVGSFTFQTGNNKKSPIVIPARRYKIFEEFLYPKPFYLLAAEEAKSITLNSYVSDDCLAAIQDIMVYRLKNNPL